METTPAIARRRDPSRLSASEEPIPRRVDREQNLNEQLGGCHFMRCLKPEHSREDRKDLPGDAQANRQPVSMGDT